MARINDENILTVVTRGSWLLLALLTAASLALASDRFTAGVVAGGLLAMANFYWLRHSLERILQLQPARPSAAAVLRSLVRLALLAIAVYLLITRFGVDVLGLLLGLSILVITILAVSLFAVIRPGG